MNKQEAILFLEKKRDKAIGYMGFFGEGNRKGLMNEIRVNTYDIAINTLQQIDEPQAEKVEVPDWFDQWYKAVKNDSVYSEETALKLINQCGWGHMLEYPSGENVPDSNMTEWINENRLLANRAILDGYTVKPKRWVVRAGDYHSTYVDSLTITSEKSRHTISGKEKAHYFTDKTKAEAVAVLVEGSVEEV